MTATKMLPIGTKVVPYGKIVSWLYTGGERYYLFVGKGGHGTMIPVDAIVKMWRNK